MNDEKVIDANSPPSIDRGTGARTKMSNKRFLAFMMVGIMIVAAVSMIAPSILGNNGDDNDQQLANTSNFASGTNRVGIYTVNHLFEMYLKNGGSNGLDVPNGAGRGYTGSNPALLAMGSMANFTKQLHGGNGSAHPAQERYLGHHNESLMGVNEWLNTSAGGYKTSWRGSTYDEETLRNTYPYIFFWNPAPAGTGQLYAPLLPGGLATWAPFRISASVGYDTALRTGKNDLTSGASTNGRNVPFLPTWNHSRAASGDSAKGGYVNISSYGSYITDSEMDAITIGVPGWTDHFANWYYGLPTGTTIANDGYVYEWHGTITLSRQALITFLNWTPGFANYWSDGIHGKAPRHVDETNAVTWFNNELATRGMAGCWKDWLVENFSQSGSPTDSAYWRNTVNNGDIFTNYETGYDVYPGDTYVSLKVDPSTTGYNATPTSGEGLSIRFYIIGWGPDAALLRMIEQSNIMGSFGTTGTTAFYRRSPIVNYGEDMYLNCSIRESMANSSLRYTATYSMLGWEDSAKDVWSGGYMIELGSHNDYEPNILGSEDAYPSPFTKYTTGPAAFRDPYITAEIAAPKRDSSKTRDWNVPGSTRFNNNASVELQAPENKNLTAYEAIIVDLNILSSPWLVAKGWQAKYGSQTMALQPYAGLSDVDSANKLAEYQRWLYWGTVKLGKGCYPQGNILGMYNNATKTLNLSGGSTGLAMNHTYSISASNLGDYWGGTGEASSGTEIYLHGQPMIQFDVSPIKSYQVTIQPSSPADRQVNTNYWVKVTPLNATGYIPRNGAGVPGASYTSGKLIVNNTITFSTNNVGATWPTGLPAPAIGNGTSVTFNNVTNPGGSAWTVVRFATISATTVVNIQDQQFNYRLGGSNVPLPLQASGNQRVNGTSGVFNVIAIPEFATIIIPILGMMAIFMTLSIRKRKRKG